MDSSKRKSTIIVAAMIVLTIIYGLFNSIIVANAATYNNVTCINRYTKTARKSGIILVGDSRTYGMLTNNTSFAGCGNVGAHFWKGYNDSTKPYYSSYILGKFTTANGTSYNGSMTKLKEQAQLTIQENGYCHIWFFSTINDAVVCSNNYKGAVDCMVDKAIEAQKWNAKYNGKTVYVKVHVVHLIPDKNKTQVSSTYTSNFNTYEDSKIDTYNKSVAKGYQIAKTGYAGIVNGTASVAKQYIKDHPGAKLGYLSDNVHYTNDTYKAIGVWIKNTSTKY